VLSLLETGQFAGATGSVVVVESSLPGSFNVHDPVSGVAASLPLVY